MVLLEPKKENCNFICNHLVWLIDFISSREKRSAKIFDTRDLHDAIFCCGLFSCQTPLSDSDINDSGIISPFEMCSEAIIEGRKNADPSSPFFMFGFKAYYLTMGNSWEMHILGAIPSFGKKSFDFDDSLEKKRPGRKHLDLTFELKIGAWSQSYYVLAVKD